MAQEAADSVSFKLISGKTTTELSLPKSTTVAQLKERVHKEYGIPPEMQKIMFKGLLKDNNTLDEAGIKKASRVMVIGSRPADILAAATPAAAAGAGADVWDPSEPKKQEPWCTETQHKKILDKGKPDDAQPGISGRQIALRDDQLVLGGMMNSQGTKVRLTFKPTTRELWIGSATSTQKVPYGMIRKIESQPIAGQEEYSILAVHLGETGTNRYWLYWVPSQYVAGIKMRLLGVQALI
ncbi:hypothetical protein WJX72_003746 [[Myrmecia] bisecta]|uniref:Ubiquitin-like domain-containing protein n=1 Tax=[Myrmecia] bisecta TaxID=41462 RepID=A0AAW1QEQ2_9CHLO